MSVGAVAGLVAGLLMDAYDPAAAGVDGASVSVATDKADYKRGEPVAIRIANTGTVPLEPAESWSLRVTGLSGMVMYSMPDGAFDTLEPGTDTYTVWNQTKDGGGGVLEGIYRISVRGHGPDGFAVQDSVTVTVWK